MTRDQARDWGMLVVEDDDGTRRALCHVFADEGYVVQDAADGHEALDLLRRSPVPLVVLTDHSTTRLDGRGLIQAVLADPVLHQRHAYIFLTAVDHRLSSEYRQQLATLHAPILHKPFDLDRLLAAVASAAARLRGDEPPLMRA